MSFSLVKNNAQTITTLTNIFFGSVARPQKLKTRTIKNAKKITYSQWKSFAFETIAFFCNLTCLFMVTLYSSLSQFIEGKDQLWFVSDSMFVAACLSSIFHTMSYVNDIKVEKLTQSQIQEKLVTIQDILYGALKSLYLFIHPSEYFAQIQLDSQFFPTLNTFLTAISYFRIIFIYCYLSKNSRYYGTRISRLLSVYGHRNSATNIVYSIKCLFKEKGMIANTFLLVFTITFLGLIGILVSDQKELNIEMYYLIETMATIGYGQFSLKNSIERFLFILAIISGSFAASVFTIDLLQFLQLEDKQQKAYRLIKRLQFRDKILETKLDVLEKFLKSRNTRLYRKNAVSHWKQYEKQLQVDKSPMVELLTVKYTYFCSSLKMLLERQLLSSNLLTFYFNRMSYYEMMKQHMVSHGTTRPNSKRRVEDSQKIYQIKEKILGYRK